MPAESAFQLLVVAFALTAAALNPLQTAIGKGSLVIPLPLVQRAPKLLCKFVAVGHLKRWAEGLTPACPRSTVLVGCRDYLMNRLSAPSECRAQALYCRMVADTATEEQVRTLWVSMAQTWTKLAEAM
jgi:hypothetical protein